MREIVVNIAYLVAAVLFIFGLKGLSHPRTAVRANLMGAAGMFIAVVVTLLDQHIIGYLWIAVGIVIGSAIGAWLATSTPMTNMPQMVALLNGFGGGASIFVAGAALIEALTIVTDGTPDVVYDTNLQFTIATALSGLIGGVTLTGSLVAYGKLEGFVKDLRMGAQQAIMAILFLATIGLSVWLVIDPNQIAYWAIVGIACVLGVLLVIAIGGADMPVVIALLNSYSGLAAAATGFVITNNVLIITGSLVGASGIILSTIMCKAMNRSLTNVLFGVWVATDSGPSADEVYGGKVKSASAEELAMLLDGVGRVVVVPGFGMAVAQAQHAVRDLANLLESRGTEVEFAIHPVAGRMPGHMNVLLAEADIPYEKLKEMDEINPTFDQVDVVIVIGANDVVNPEARTNPQSPIAGMPILDVDKARSVIVVKRSLSPGFAGIPNPLFAAENTQMFFADAKKGIVELASAIKEG
ncbi:MAG: NAD(P)(+) transhydrogenase (Re/Si-specific) subunit beta [Chloroflexaceae bacterium]|nr:NAD(P)(+) transhydrogenase (Re/Si-specific) subunit beta [Chloroflexaceae bacterium]